MCGHLGLCVPAQDSVSAESVLCPQLPGGPGDLRVALFWPRCCGRGGSCCMEASEHVLEEQLRL